MLRWLPEERTLYPDTFMESLLLREAKELETKADNLNDLVGLVKNNKKIKTRMYSEDRKEK